MILFIEGLNETQEIALTLQQQGHDVLTKKTCFAGSLLTDNLSVIDMVDIITEHDVTCVVDASHPFAVETSNTAMQAAIHCGVSYIRYEHPQLVM